VAWALACLVGLAAMGRLSQQAGPREPVGGAAATDLARLDLDGERFTLVMVLHPRCPCSQASLAELERLQARLEGRLAVRLVFVVPEGAEAGFAATSLVERARRLPDAEVLLDRGALALALGASTSGAARLFAPDGALRFQGGLTVARGEEGQSASALAVEALVRAGPAAPLRAVAEAPSFGCPLRTPAAGLRL
jgi:hypothetical protein